MRNWGRLWIIAVVSSVMIASLAWMTAASARTKQAVTFEQDLVGNLCTEVVSSGTWTASGAIDDAGTVTGSPIADRIHERVLIGTDGTIHATLAFTFLKIGETGFVHTERWWITSGTGAYEGLRGRGTGGGTAVFSGDSICPTVTGTDVWTGTIAS